MSAATIKIVVALVFYAWSWFEDDPITSLLMFAAAVVWTFGALREARS